MAGGQLAGTDRLGRGQDDEPAGVDRLRDRCRCCSKSASLVRVRDREMLWLCVTVWLLARGGGGGGTVQASSSWTNGAVRQKDKRGLEYKYKQLKS